METAGTDDEQRIVRWRLEVLLAAGYSTPAAERIAARADSAAAIDLHHAVRLLNHGCPEHLALEILL